MLTNLNQKIVKKYLPMIICNVSLEYKNGLVYADQYINSSH